MTILEAREAIESQVPMWLPLAIGLGLAIFAWYAGRNHGKA